jgi:hypothetical protein
LGACAADEIQVTDGKQEQGKEACSKDSSQEQDHPKDKAEKEDIMSTRSQVPSRFSEPIRPAQLDYIRDLLVKKDLLKSSKFFDAVNAMDESELAAYIEQLKGEAAGLTKDKASDWLDVLIDLPWKPRDEQPVPQGHWAVSYADHDVGTSKFHQVGYLHREKDGKEQLVPRGSYALDTSSDGHWKNDVTFFSVWIGAPDDSQRRGWWSVKMYLSDEKVKLHRKQQIWVLEQIAKDPAAAASRYGLESEHCGICGRKLTKDESRARGIGPVCAERWGW